MATYSEFGKPFYITLAPGNSPNQVYTCGQKVKGTVVWRPSSYAFARIELQFKGVVETRVEHSSMESSSTARGKASLFEYSCILSPTLIQNNHETRSWPFEFDFPYEAQPVLTNSPWSEHHGFHCFPGHPLPPSWVSPYGLQSISYYIEVIAHKASSAFHSKVKDRMTLFFSPSRDVEHPDPQQYTQNIYLTRSSRKLDSALTENPRNFKDTARRLFGSSIPSEPLSCFVINSEVPRVACVNGLLPIIVGIEHDLAKSTSREIPVVYLNSILARLTEYTNVRAPNFSKSDLSSHTKSSESKIIIAQKHSMREPMLERMCLAKDIRGLDLRIGQSIAPSFQTYSVTRTYSIKVVIKVSCVGKEYDLELAKHKLLILPAIMVPRIEPYEPLDSEQLPRYEEVISQ